MRQLASSNTGHSFVERLKKSYALSFIHRANRVARLLQLKFLIQQRASSSQSVLRPK
jgi:hypothetical protein